MKNTNCKKCLFANPSDSESPCEHGVIQHIRDLSVKELDIVDGFFVIKDYNCKMGFSTEVYENNKDNIDINELKQHLIANMIKIYLVLDITNISINDTKTLCDALNNLSVVPKFISFLCFDKQSLSTEIIENMRSKLKTAIVWKIHIFVEQSNYADLVHSVLSSNRKANDSQLILFYDWRNIKQLDSDINEINTICNIEQKDFHLMLKNSLELDNNNYNGILISFENYMTCRRVSDNIVSAITDNQDIIIHRYG